MKHIRSILVLRALQLGDLMCSIPALRALRAFFPSAEIVLAGLPTGRKFVSRFGSYLDDFIQFPGHPFLAEQPYSARRMSRFLSLTHERRFSLALQMHGNGSVTNPIIALTGARQLAGFYPAGGQCPGKLFLPYPEKAHEILRCLRLIRFLGIPHQGTEMEFPVSPREQRECDETLRYHLLRPRQYVVFHPGARAPARRWSAESFASVADTVSRLGYRTVVTGSSEETGLSGQMKGAMKNSTVDLCGKLSLGGMAAVIGTSRLLVSNDTSVSHIAAALRTPSVVIMTASSPERWRPRNKNLHSCIYARVHCRPCNFKDCPYPGHPCSSWLSPQTVSEKVRRALGSNRIECYERT